MNSTVNSYRDDGSVSRQRTGKNTGKDDYRDPKEIHAASMEFMVLLDQPRFAFEHHGATLGESSVSKDAPRELKREQNPYIQSRFDITQAPESMDGLVDAITAPMSTQAGEKMAFTVSMPSLGDIHIRAQEHPQHWQVRMQPQSAETRSRLLRERSQINEKMTRALNKEARIDVE